MTKKTHIAAGVAITLPIILNLKFPLLSSLGILGSIAADWDIFLILLGFKHRTITHSILALALSTLLIAILNSKIAIVWGINYLMHLILDSFTKMGVPFFYPFNKKYYGLKTVYTGGAEDLFVDLMLIYFIFCVMYP